MSSPDFQTVGEDPFMEYMKAERLKAKNRKSQKKYRAKLKEKGDENAKRVEALQDALEDALRQKAALQSECTAMEERRLLELDPAEAFVPAVSQYNRHLLRTRVRLVLCLQKEFTCIEIAKMTASELMDIQQVMLSGMKDLFRLHPEDAFNDPDNDAHKRLQKLIQEKHGFHAYCSAHNPRVIHQVLYIKSMQLNGAKLSGNEQRKILDSFQLSGEQIQHIIWHRARFLQVCPRLGSARLSLSKALQHLRPDDHTGWAQMCLAIRNNVDKEHLAFCRFHAQLWNSDGLTPIQEAKLWTGCQGCTHSLLSIFDCDGDAGISGMLDGEVKVDPLEPAPHLPDPMLQQHQSIGLKMAQLSLRAAVIQSMGEEAARFEIPITFA